MKVEINTILLWLILVLVIGLSYFGYKELNPPERHYKHPITWTA